MSLQMGLYRQGNLKGRVTVDWYGPQTLRMPYGHAYKLLSVLCRVTENVTVMAESYEEFSGTAVFEDGVSVMGDVHDTFEEF